jgi:hypothetical protein
MLFSVSLRRDLGQEFRKREGEAKGYRVAG